MNRHEILRNIYRNDDIPAIDSTRTTVCWRPLDLEALGLSLYSLFVNPALHLSFLAFLRIFRKWPMQSSTLPGVPKRCSEFVIAIISHQTYQVPVPR